MVKAVKKTRQKVIITHNPSEIDKNQLLLVRFPNLGIDDIIVLGMANLSSNIKFSSMADSKRSLVSNIGRAITKRLAVQLMLWIRTLQTYDMRLLLMHTGTLSSSLWTLKCWTVQCPITSMGLETDYVMKSCSTIMNVSSYHQDHHDFLHHHEDPINDGFENTRQSLSNMHAQLTEEPCQGFQFVS